VERTSYLAQLPFDVAGVLMQVLAFKADGLAQRSPV
jgi:hypothetical protein